MQENENNKVFQYIKEWKPRLIDFPRRNRLLYFKHAKMGNLSVSSPDAETVFTKLVHRKRSLEFWMPPEERDYLRKETPVSNLDFPQHPQKPTPSQLVCEDVAREDLEKILKKLNRRSLLDYRERGVRILYAAFGLVTWREIATKEEVHTPLIMVPVASLAK